MTDKITVELTLAEARVAANAPHYPELIRERIKAALPPEWEEGQMALVKPTGSRYSYYGVWDGENWSSPDGGWISTLGYESVKPIRVLRDDEVAVKKPNVHPDAFRAAAKILDEAYYHGLADWLLRCVGTAKK